jgi:hypothetical protein
MFFLVDYRVGTETMPSLTLCLSQPSTPIQNSHGLPLLMGCLQVCSIRTALLRAWVGWHLLPDMGPGSIQCVCEYLLNTGQGPVITPTGQQYTYCLLLVAVESVIPPIWFSYSLWMLNRPVLKMSLELEYLTHAPKSKSCRNLSEFCSTGCFIFYYIISRK